MENMPEVPECLRVCTIYMSIFAEGRVPDYSIHVQDTAQTQYLL